MINLFNKINYFGEKELVSVYEINLLLMRKN